MTEQAQFRSGALGEYGVAGRVALIAGGTGGIGAAVARRLAGAGAQVLVGYLSGGERAASLLENLPGGPHAAIHLPLSDSGAIRLAATGIERDFGRLDILINAAGRTYAIPHADLNALTDEIFDEIMVTNVRGPYALIREFAPLLRAGGDSVVINVSSVSGRTGLGSNMAYCAAKAALDVLGKSLARVLGPQARVIGIAPAAVATDFVPGRSRAAIERQAAFTPLKVASEPDDVALAIMGAITHLRLTTGDTLLVDSGRHL